MNENKKEFKIDFGGKEVTIETGRLAKQADGSVLVSSGGSQVLVTVCSSREVKDGQDFFPLTVDYIEKFYAAGKMLGGFMKRETRPSTRETLNARLIDRPIRPLFPKGYMFETTVTATVMSYSEDGDTEILASLGTSAALAVSDIPFQGPLGSCKVGRIDGKLIINPSLAEWENSDLELVVSASPDAILMVEGEGSEIPEAEMLEAIKFGHEHIKKFCELMVQMEKEAGKTKREFVSVKPNETMMKTVTSKYTATARTALEINDKLIRQKAVKELEHKVAEDMKSNFSEYGLEESSGFGKEAYKSVDELLYNMLRGDILNEEKRIGGRAIDQVRAIETEANILKGPHGSGLFTRGETQVLSIVTLGGSKGEQMIDSIQGLDYEKFYLHYNFPPYSVGEARGKYGTSRRELGHGNLAQRGLKAVLPSVDDFSYTTRVVCEVLESNGSSSMASVCSGSMALMDAGVPLKAPVAGIAMGLVKEGDNFKILTDILGDEDHLGDMDFKIAGTDKGINAIQMDIKITGITEEIITNALDQARVGRIHILGEMAKTLSTHRPEFKEGVPRIVPFKIEPDQIGALIGPGGKVIKAIQEEFEVTIEVLEDGTVRVLGVDTDKLNECVDRCKLILNGPAVGSVYTAEVVSIKDYGTFVDIAPGVSGLVHVSEIANERVENVADYVAPGDKIEIKVLEVDKMGRAKLSAKAVKPLEKK